MLREMPIFKGDADFEGIDGPADVEGGDVEGCFEGTDAPAIC